MDNENILGLMILFVIIALLFAFSIPWELEKLHRLGIGRRKNFNDEKLGSDPAPGSRADSTEGKK